MAWARLIDIIACLSLWKPLVWEYGNFQAGNIKMNKLTLLTS